MAASKPPPVAVELDVESEENSLDNSARIALAREVDLNTLIIGPAKKRFASFCNFSML